MPALADEYVALGAHYDHLGTARTPNAAGDTIYNGADDDGSGTVGLLAIAEAFATTRTRPKRSLLFVWHTGEEQGLWGSRYFTEHPTVPLDRVVAQLNIDMIGRGRAAGTPAPNGPLALTDSGTVYVVGSRRLSTSARRAPRAGQRALPRAAPGLLARRRERPGPDLPAQRSLPVREARHSGGLLLHGRAPGLPRPRGRGRAHRFREVAARDPDHLRDRSTGRRHAPASEGRCAIRRGGHDPLSVRPSFRHAAAIWTKVENRRDPGARQHRPPTIVTVALRVSPRHEAASGPGGLSVGE